MSDQKSLLAFDELLQSVYGKYVGFARGSRQFSFDSVVTDSRAVKPGSLFVPLIGENQDGHKYIPDALKAGASVVFVTDSVYEKNPKYYLRSSRECSPASLCFSWLPSFLQFSSLLSYNIIYYFKILLQRYKKVLVPC